MTLRVFTAALGAEINTFSPLPVDRSRFEELWLFPAASMARDGAPPLIAAQLQRLWALEDAGEVQVVQGLCAGAQPGGIISREAYEGLRDELLDDLVAAGPVDIVILGLHGAMVSDGCDDCEGDLMSRVRAIIGPDTILAALLDPHCHLTATMLALSDLLIAYKQYPHDDIVATADRLVDLAVAQARGAIRPVMRAWDCRTIGTFNTYREPMKTLVDALIAETAADPALIDISIAHGFPWGDTADAGTRVWATANGDTAAASAAAERFGRRMEAIRADCQPRLLTPAQAVALAREPGAPLILAETADNPGGGAPSDATHLVRALIDKGIEGIAAGIFWDPVAVSLCLAAGEGAVLPLRIGGGVSRMSGDPLDLEVRVMSILDDLRQPFGGGTWPSGRVVRVESSTATFILGERRTQCFATEAFTELGVDLAAKRVIVVKSSNHFEASFRRLSDRIETVATAGVLTPDPSQLPYVKLRRPIWPIDGDVAGAAMPFV